MATQTQQSENRAFSQPPKRESLGPAAAQVGDIWHRVEGAHLGDEAYRGMELEWTTWRCTKTTPQGAWFTCLEWSYKKPRFALTSGSRAISRTKQEALERLIARKVRHLRILNGQAVAAQDTLEVARATLAQFKGSAGAATAESNAAVLEKLDSCLAL